MTPIYDAPRVLRAARFAARRLAMPAFESWVEDITQEVALAVLLAHRRGFKCGRRVYQHYALDAMRRLLGDTRCRGRAQERDAVSVDDLPLPVRAAVDGPGALALWRMQAAWPTLTPIQRAALYTVMSGHPHDTGDAAAATGTSSTALLQARKTALRRIDNPRAFARRACVNVRGLPEAERKAYHREVGQRARARRRSREAEVGR